MPSLSPIDPKDMNDRTFLPSETRRQCPPKLLQTRQFRYRQSPTHLEHKRNPPSRHRETTTSRALIIPHLAPIETSTRWYSAIFVSGHGIPRTTAKSFWEIPQGTQRGTALRKSTAQALRLGRHLRRLLMGPKGTRNEQEIHPSWTGSTSVPSASNTPKSSCRGSPTCASASAPGQHRRGARSTPTPEADGR